VPSMEVVGGKDSTFFKHVFFYEILLITKIETREHEKGNNIQVIKMKNLVIEPYISILLAFLSEMIDRNDFYLFTNYRMLLCNNSR
jgi:hypothetical protein